MSYHQKYQKRGQYLLHPDLIEYKRGGWGFQIKFHAIVLTILALFDFYPTWLMSFDLTLAVLVVGFWMFGKTILLKGKFPIKAYYKRDYENDNLLFISKLLIHGSVVRTVIVSLFFAIQLYVAQGERFELRDIKQDIMQALINPVPQAIAIIVFLFFFYYMFLKEKYMSIDGFSREVMKIVRERNFSINQAVVQFMHLRDSMLEKEMLDGVKYEYSEDLFSENVKDNVPKENTKSQPVFQQTSKPKTEPVFYEEPSAPLRRQSRR